MDNGASSYRRFLQGDENGFIEIVRDDKDGLILYLSGIVGSISLAEELTQDAFVRLGIKKPRFSGTSSFKTWLYAIGRNLALDFLRKAKRRGEIPLGEHRKRRSKRSPRGQITDMLFVFTVSGCRRTMNCIRRFSSISPQNIDFERTI